ncbi:hypothetical protein O6H91_12G101400 [Diphasiastrum complanatum]|uniref:Uncharacterized protein n=1 Tax=Diphasiastrum complanatum TaxID=34168 RepID=A0ACC2C585_DIPCM|nr:hypothetical protein O6H91_12G101400 [Diphasiastrum complanatum]
MNMHGRAAATSLQEAAPTLHLPHLPNLMNAHCGDSDTNLAPTRPSMSGSTGCKFTGAYELAEIVRSAPRLKRLVLEWNDLGVAKTGVTAFAYAIAASPTLNEV